MTFVFPPFVDEEPGVYAIHDSDGGVYVGCSKNIPARLRYHRAKLKANKHPNERMQAAWNARGEGAFIACVLEPTSDYYAAEARWVAAFDCVAQGWNRAPGGGGFQSHTLATRQKIALAKRGSRNPAKNNRDAISAGLRGRALSDEHRANIGAAVRGKLLGELNPAKRPEVRAKIAAARRGVPVGPRPQHAESMRGRISITDGTTTKRVRPESLDAFLIAGWRRSKR